MVPVSKIAQSSLYQISRYSCSPVHEKHDDHAEQGRCQREPRAVVAERRTPVWSFGDACVEHREVDHGEGGHEEVGQDCGDLGKRRV